MGCIISTIDKIDCTYFSEIPVGKAILVKKAIRIAHTSCFIFQDELGRLFTNHTSLSKNYAMNADGLWDDEVVKALVKLGVITQKDYLDHKEAAIAHRKKRDYKYDKESLLKLSKNLKIKLTKSQLKQLGE